MKRLIFTVLFLLCLLIPASVTAEQGPQDQEEMSRMQMTLREYRQDGYEMLGPMQYLGRSTDKIKLYKHDPVSYRILDTVDETGEMCSLKKHDFVYVLSKHGHVVLIRLDKHGGSR